MGASSLPRWVKVVHFVDRQVTRAYHLHEVIRDELLFAFTPASNRTALTALAYSEESAVYAPGGKSFDSGLFDWEISALELMQVAPSARVLIGGIGGGRELPALSKRAREVVAFEPNPRLFDLARRAAEPLGNVSVHRGSYDDFVAAVFEHRGPLLALRGSFEAVILGRGSLAHLTDDLERIALLRALRESSPRAPLLVSFVLRSAVDLGGSLLARRALRSLFARLGGRSVDAGLRYRSRRGFVHEFTEEEIRGLAAQSGYSVAEFKRSPYAFREASSPAHAVLFPIASKAG